MPSKLERKFGKYAISNLTLYLIIGYVIGYIINMFNPNLYEYLTFNPYYIVHGQVWRILTWVLTMPQSLGIFTIIMLFLYYSLGSSLERTWGTYRYNTYIFSGLLFTVVGSIILYFALVVFYSETLAGTMYSAYVGKIMGEYISAIVSTYYINMSIFLAFAVTYPDMQLMLYFIIPIKVKWFGYLYGGFILYDIISSFTKFSEARYIPIIKAAVIIFSLLNFLIYWLTGRVKKVGQVKRKKQYRQSVNKGQHQNVYGNGARHQCYICGRTNITNPELTFRYCSKCSGAKEYCQDHLFTHAHS